MKSKSFQIKESPVEQRKLNKTFDFVGLYPTAAETNAKLSEKRKSGDNVIAGNSYHTKAIGDTPKRERSPNKKSKKGKNVPIDVSQIHIDGQSLGPLHTSTPGRSSPVGGPRATPLAKDNTSTATHKVKSIMKNSFSNDDAMDGSKVELFTHKPKKRNKSVSFMLEDHEEVAVKKTKSEDSVKVDAKLDKKTSKRDKIEMKKNFKKLKKNLKEAEKENKKNNMETDQVNRQVQEKKSHLIQKKEKTEEPNNSEKTSNTDTAVNDQPEKKKKVKKNKKPKQKEDITEPTESESNNNEQVEPKNKKSKKKKRKSKNQVGDSTETEGEPAVKNLKKEPKADVIAEDLENLSIGDNAHTLTNLLDEMTVVDNDKKKKNKVKRKKAGKSKTPSVSSSETADLEKIEEGKEKVKWRKRKWNKDRKGDADDNLENVVIVDNLPLNLMLTYKKVLAEYFTKFGLIKKIGIAEVYPTEESKPVFTTTIIFYSDGAASKALEEDNTEHFGSRIRVRPQLPPTQTTLVVRSYGELTDQAISSVFSGAGRIRNIRFLVKGRKSLATAFIEFDGPASVKRAIKMAEDAKIGGKKIHVSKFEQRGSKRDKKVKNNAESENEGDSEDSNE